MDKSVGMKNRSKDEETPKKSKASCQGGYGYMKRRLGLLSFEADKLKGKDVKPDQEEI